jgi:hypothetical protein
VHSNIPQTIATSTDTRGITLSDAPHIVNIHGFADFFSVFAAIHIAGSSVNSYPVQRRYNVGGPE